MRGITLRLQASTNGSADELIDAFAASRRRREKCFLILGGKPDRKCFAHAESVTQYRVVIKLCASGRKKLSLQLVVQMAAFEAKADQALPRMIAINLNEEEKGDGQIELIHPSPSEQISRPRAEKQKPAEAQGVRILDPGNSRVTV